MRLTIITTNSFPQGMAATSRINMYGRGLINSGAEIIVWPIWATEKYNNIKNKDAIGSYEGIQFSYPKTSIRPQTLIGRKIQDCLDFLRVCAKICMLNKKSDLVLLYMNSWWKELIFLLILKTKGIPICRELCEYPYATTTNKGLVNKLNKFISTQIVFKLYNGFIAISETLKDVALRHKNRNAKIVKIPILVSTDFHKDSSYKNNKPYIFHGGTMYEQKDAIISTMKAFGEACKVLNYSVDFILAGPRSPHIEELNQIIKEYDIEDNVKFYDVQPKTIIQEFQNGASLCILNKHDNLQNRCGFSTKLGEILLSETPVITTTVGEANYWLKDGESAYITTPGDFHKISNEIVRAFTDEDLRKRIAANGKKIALENFDAKKQGGRLFNFLNEIKYKSR